MVIPNYLNYTSSGSIHKQRFPIAPQWIPPARTACQTPTECLEASDSAENAPAMLPRWNDGMLPSTRWVRWWGRGDELRLRRVVPGGHTGPTRLSRPLADDRHRSTVTGRESLEVGHSAHEGQLCSAFPAPADSLSAIGGTHSHMRAHTRTHTRPFRHLDLRTFLPGTLWWRGLMRLVH